MAKTSQPKKNKPRLTKAKLSKEIEAKPGSFSGLSVDVFLLLDENLNLLSINDAGQKMFGVSRADVVGKCILDIIPDIKNTGIYKKYRQVLETGKSIVAHLELGGRHLSIQLFQQGDALGMIAADITGRKRMEEALRESDSRYHALSEVVFDGIVVHEKGKIIEATEKYAQLFGYEPSEIIGKDLLTLVTPEYHNSVREKIFSGYTKPYETVGLRKDGTTFQVEVNTLEMDYRGRNVRLGVLRDITERKKAEESLKESEEKHRALVDTAGKVGEGIAIVQDVEGREAAFVFVNDEFRKMVGFSREELLSMKAQDVLRPAEFSEILDRYRSRQRRENAPALYELTVVHKDGTLIPIEAGFSIMTHSGKVATVAFLRDITERKRVEEALRRSEELYRTLFENMLEGFAYCKMLFDDHGRPVDWVYLAANRAFEQLTALKNIVGKRVTEAIPGIKELNPELFEIYGRVALTGQPERFVIYFKPLSIWLNISVFSPAKEYFVAVFENITERKKAEETLRQSEQNYRVLFEGTLDGLFVVSAETGRIVLANRSAAKMFGFDSPEAMIGVYPINFVTSQTGDEALRFVAEDVLRDLSEEWSRSNHEAHEIRALANDGREIWLEIQGTPTEHEGKLAYLVSNKDITERKQVEEQVRRHSHDLDLLSKAAIALVELRPDADIHHFIAEWLQEFAEGAAVLVNSFDEASDTFCLREALGIGEQMEALTKILGFNLIGMPTPISDEARQGLSSSELAKVQGGIYDLASGAIPMPVCHEIEKLLDVGNVYAIGFAWEGRLYGSAVILTRNRTELRNKDVIETFVRQASIALQRRQAEEALKESEEKYRALIEATGRAGEGIIIIQDREEREAAFVFVNDEFCRMSGYSREELLNRSAWDLVPYEIAVRLKDWYKLRHMGEALPGHYEAAGVRKDGTIVPLDLSVVTMPWQGKIATVLYIRDITERKRMEEALRKSEQTIRQLAKASTHAHEEERQRVSLEVHDRISQTLTGAFHQLQALESIPIENTEAQQILNRASALLQESIRESRSIMEDLYSPVLSDFGIVAVIDEELRRFHEETGCRTKLDKRFAVRPTRDVELTAYRIFREVLANIKRHAIGASEVKVFFSCEAGVVSLQVKDNGPGFDVEAALQNGRMGGLMGMQRRAELGGGTCEVISSRGHGTTVTVRLPYSSEA